MTNATQQWNEHWINSPKGSITINLLFPRVYCRFNYKYLLPNSILTQFLTGHGKFKTYILRLKDILNSDDIYVALCHESTQSGYNL